MLLVSLSVSWTINPIVSLLLLLGKLSLLAKRQLRKYSWRWNSQYQMYSKILWMEWYNRNTGRCIACRFSIMAYWDALNLDPHLRFQLRINTNWSKMVIQIYNIQLCVIHTYTIYYLGLLCPFVPPSHDQYSLDQPVYYFGNVHPAIPLYSTHESPLYGLWSLL